MIRMRNLWLPAVAALLAAPGLLASGPVRWQAEIGPVPNTATTQAPGLAEVGTSSNPRVLLFWTRPKAFQIAYQSAISLRHNKWSPPSLVDSGKALTDASPSATVIGTAQVLVAWKNVGNPAIEYSVGTVGKGSVLAWGPPLTIPGAAASSGPAAFAVVSPDDVLVAWKAAAGTGIDYSLGQIGKSGAVRWGKIAAIPRADTTGSPSITEAVVGPRDTLEVYVFWRAPGERVDFSFATDMPELSKFSGPIALPPKVLTGDVPVATQIVDGKSLPLMVVYREAQGSELLYVTLNNGKLAGPFAVPRIRTTYGTALLYGLLAAVAPDQPLLPEPIDMEPFVHPCAGC
jgi:hypothetical protein